MKTFKINSNYEVTGDDQTTFESVWASEKCWFSPGSVVTITNEENETKTFTKEETQEKKPIEFYSRIYLFVPDEDTYYYIAEGDGCNLLEEDEEEGYIDYIYYTIYDENGEIDGGLMLLEEYYQDKFKSADEVIKYVLDDRSIHGFHGSYNIMTEEEWELLGLENY